MFRPSSCNEPKFQYFSCLEDRKRMAFETKEECYQKIISQKKPICPHCHTEMSIWETPPFSFGDGLGWGVPYLFVCFNDACELYTEGWQNIEENFGQAASYRCMCYPGSQNFECMPVFSPVGAKGQVIDDQNEMQEEMLKESIKRGFSILADCYVAKDGVTVLRMLLDAAEPGRVRLKAAEMIGDLGEVEAVDPLRSHRFGEQSIQEMVDRSIEKIHHRFKTRECPHCAEIIPRNAQSCQYCGKESAP